jgi:transposase
MPRAIALAQREQIVALRNLGHSLATIAQQLGLRYRTVRHLATTYRKHGTAGLAIRYDRCGQRETAFPAPLHQAALTLKREHPPWGGGLIRLVLDEGFPKTPLPSCRTLQRWFAKAGLNPARARQPAVKRQRARAVHEVWEVDAKEQMRLCDGSGTCVLTATDEASGALLGAASFPPLLLEPGLPPRRARGAALLLCLLGSSAADPRG